MTARQQLQKLLSGGADRGSNIVSALVETVTRLVVQELREGEQADYLGGRGRDERRDAGQVVVQRYAPGRVCTAEGVFEMVVPQARCAAAVSVVADELLDDNSEMLKRLASEMYARGLSTRDVEDAFRDATGELLISKSAVSKVTDRTWEDYQSGQHTAAGARRPAKQTPPRSSRISAVVAVVNNPPHNNASQSAHTSSNLDACPQQPPDRHRATTG